MQQNIHYLKIIMNCASFLSYIQKHSFSSLILNMFFPHLPVLYGDLLKHSPGAEKQPSSDLSRVWRDSIPWLWTISLHRGCWWWWEGVISGLSSIQMVILSSVQIWIQKCNQKENTVPSHNWPVVKVRRCIWLKASSRLRLIGHKNAAALLSVGWNFLSSWDHLAELLVCFQPSQTSVCSCFLPCLTTLWCHSASRSKTNNSQNNRLRVVLY